jgi:hypothetical protein
VILAAENNKNVINFQLTNFESIIFNPTAQFKRIRDICIYNIFKIFTMYILDSFESKNGGLSFQPSKKL